jgi:hypothetical protein
MVINFAHIIVPMRNVINFFLMYFIITTVTNIINIIAPRAVLVTNIDY